MLQARRITLGGTCTEVIGVADLKLKVKAGPGIVVFSSATNLAGTKRIAFREGGLAGGPVFGLGRPTDFGIVSVPD